MRRVETLVLIALLAFGVVRHSVVSAQVQVRLTKPVRVSEPAVAPVVQPTFTAQGGFESSPEKARQSALLAAKEKFRDYLINQDTPIDREPGTELVRRMLLPEQEQVQEEAIKSPTSEGTETMYRVTVAVKVQREHLRTMRTRDRSSEALGYIGVAALILFATAGFFRLDAMTKGYVTTWLLLGTVGVGTLLLGLWGYAWPW